MARLPQVNGDDGIWGQILNDYLLVSHNADGSEKATGGTLPDWFQSGSNIPVGQVTPAQKGALYQDTTNGGLYEAIGTSNSDWVQLGGGPGPEGLGVTTDQYGDTVVTGGASGSAVLSDIGGLAGTGNGFYWVTNGTDGEQSARMTLGSTGQHVHHWNADGTYTLPDGTILGGGTDTFGALSSSSGPETNLLAPDTNHSVVYITDWGGYQGTGNGISWSRLGADGTQQLEIFLGDSGQYTHQWAADGTYTLPDTNIKGLADPAGAQDAATKHYVDTNAAVTAAKIESTFTGAGLIYQGTGAGTGTLVLPAGHQLDYTEMPGDLTVTATSDASAQAFITGSSVTYDGSTSICLEMYSPAANYTNVLGFVLFDNGTLVGRIAIFGSLSSAETSPVYIKTFLTPSSGAHTYSFRCFLNTGSASVEGAIDSLYASHSAWMRITKA